ncbi:uncharacterized protein A4U43_C04F27880 [Asparagus officinalis]|uniref:Uncharacterized protein n=1 Tax=Asparagus officinalis TaxID=4686 RepID=A0A5P1F8S6_ASPOF|nr:uncharacterized protein A4U43_C04F27880 [Asparagus officinalis]
MESGEERSGAELSARLMEIIEQESMGGIGGSLINQLVLHMVVWISISARFQAVSESMVLLGSATVFNLAVTSGTLTASQRTPQKTMIQRTTMLYSLEIHWLVIICVFFFAPAFDFSMLVFPQTATRKEIRRLFCGFYLCD